MVIRGTERVVAWLRTGSRRMPAARELLRRVGDVGLVACLVGTALALGGRHDAGRFWYVATVAVAAAGVFGHATLAGRRLTTPSSLVTLLAMAVGLLVLQVTPLPAGLFEWLAPATHAALPTWSPDGFGAWSTISVTPGETREAIALLVAHGVLAITLAQRLATVSDVRLAMKWIGWTAVGMAAIGLAQPALSNGKLLWLYEAPPRPIGDQVQGTFSNRNHFAHLLVLGLGPLLALAVLGASGGQSLPGRRRREKTSGRETVLAIAGALIVLVAILATQSRGGVIALTAFLASIAGFGWIAGWLRSKGIAAALVGSVVVLGALSLYGYEEATSRIDSLLSADMDELDRGASRRAIWGANFRALLAQPMLGFGAGSHREVYPLYLEDGYSREFTHAECGYLQVASETGIAGLALLGAVIALVGCWAWAAWRRGDEQTRPLAAAAIAAFAASLSHSVVDFVWYLPVLFGTTVAFGICLARLAERGAVDRTPERASLGRVGVGWRWCVSAGGLAWCVVVLAFPASGGFSWDSYLRSSATLRAMSADLLRRGDRAGEHTAETVRLQTVRTTELLQSVTDSDPQNARAHLRLAGRLLQRFEIENAALPNPMPIELIRDAIVRSGFPDAATAQTWLRRALGNELELLIAARRHAAIAVRLCPLQGQGYLYLARLDFIDRLPAEGVHTQLVEQALAVRPYHGAVLFEAGRQMHLLGHSDSAVELWKSSLARPGAHRDRVIAYVARMMSAEDFVRRLEPDGHATGLAIEQYQRFGSREDLLTLAQHAERATAGLVEEESPLRRSQRWCQLSSLHRALERPEEAVACSERALELAPHDFFNRHEAAAAYRSAGRHSDADPHLRWCLARRPDMKHLHGWLVEGAKADSPITRNRERLWRPRPVSTAQRRLGSSPPASLEGPPDRAASQADPPSELR